MKSYEGYLKLKLGENYVHLTNGGHKLLSDFLMANTAADTYVKKSGDTMAGTLHIKNGTDYGLNLVTTNDTYTRIRFFNKTEDEGAVIHCFVNYSSSYPTVKTLNLDAGSDWNITLGNWQSPTIFLNTHGNQRVGIGNISPLHKLDVSGGVYASSGFLTEHGRLVDNTNTNNGFIIQNGAGTNIAELTYNSNYAYICNYYGSTENAGASFYDNGDFSLFTKGSGSAIYGLNNGNIGIGTTSPSYKLHVSGTIYGTEDILISGSGSLYSNITTWSVPVSGAALALTHSNQATFRTALKATKSYIGTTSGWNSWQNVISCRHRNGGGDGNVYGMYIRTSLTNTTDSLYWDREYDGSWLGERTILDTGNYTSYCATASHNHDSVYVKKAGDNMTGTLSIKNSTDYGLNLVTTNNTFTRIRLLGSDETTGAAIHCFVNYSPAVNMFNIDASDGWKITFGSWQSPTMCMNAHGNQYVGIGTTSPLYKLDVNGVARVQSIVFTESLTYGANSSGFRIGRFDEPLGSVKIQFGLNGSTFQIIDYQWTKALFSFTNTGNLTAYGTMNATNFYTTSDRSKKTNISNLSEHIRKFTLKESNEDAYGVIAQEVPEMFREGGEGNMTVNYNSILSYYVGLLENKVKELEEKIKLLETKQQ